MPHIDCLGTFSCAAAAIGNFGKSQPTVTIAANEAYLADKTKLVRPTTGLSPSQWFSQVLMPVSQPQGRSYDLPFDALMDDVEACGLSTKMIAAILNTNLFAAGNGYFNRRLKARGFRLITKTGNSAGSTNYFYLRIPLEKEVTQAERDLA